MASMYGLNIPRAQKVFSEALVELAHDRSEIVCIVADSTVTGEADLFRDSYPDRFFNLGIAEANAIGVAAGMARDGYVPFVGALAVFATRRPYDQIAMQMAYPRTNVKLIGFTPGLTTGSGATHHAIDDVALMRALPNMTVIEAADPVQIRQAVRAIADHKGPVYMRVKRGEMPVMPPIDQDLKVGHGQLLRKGSDGVIFASGLMVAPALRAAEHLAGIGRDVAVANIHTVKPLDTEFVIDLARRTGVVVTAENHSTIGGLGSAVAETLLESGVLAGFERVGVRDCYAEGGGPEYLFSKYGLSSEGIAVAFERARRRVPGRNARM